MGIKSKSKFHSLSLPLLMILLFLMVIYKLLDPAPRTQTPPTSLV